MSALPSCTLCDDVSLCLGTIIGVNSVDFCFECSGFERTCPTCEVPACTIGLEEWMVRSQRLTGWCRNRESSCTSCWRHFWRCCANKPSKSTSTTHWDGISQSSSPTNILGAVCTMRSSAGRTKMETNIIIAPVISDWSAPIVVIDKQNEMCVCGGCGVCVCVCGCVCVWRHQDGGSHKVTG